MSTTEQGQALQKMSSATVTSEAKASTMRRAVRRSAAAAPRSSSSAFTPSDHDRLALDRYRARQRCVAPAPTFKVKYEGDGVHLAVDHPDPNYGYARLSDMLATGDTTLTGGLLDQMANVARVGKKLTERELNMMLAIVGGVAPRNPTEALLACQMAAIHNATMMAARRLNHVENIAQQDSASNMLNKLTRTFAAQIEALKRYRSTGEQNVRVTHQHVSVSAHQAVVGIQQGGGGLDEIASQSHAPSETGQFGATVLGHEQAVGIPLQGACGEGAPGLPHAWRASRGADGKSQRGLETRARYESCG